MLKNPNPGEPLNFGHDNVDNMGNLTFKWGDGMLSKPDGFLDNGKWSKLI